MALKRQELSAVCRTKGTYFSSHSEMSVHPDLLKERGVRLAGL